MAVYYDFYYINFLNLVVLLWFDVMVFEIGIDVRYSIFIVEDVFVLFWSGNLIYFVLVFLLINLINEVLDWKDIKFGLGMVFIL